MQSDDFNLETSGKTMRLCGCIAFILSLEAIYAAPTISGNMNGKVSPLTPPSPFPRRHVYAIRNTWLFFSLNG